MGKVSVHGEPKFSEGQPRVFTKQVRVKTLHELHHGPEKVKILVEAISVKDAKGYIAQKTVFLAKNKHVWFELYKSCYSVLGGECHISRIRPILDGIKPALSI